MSQARAVLPDLLTRVDAGEEVTITRHGRAVAVLVRPDALRSRRASRALADATRVHDLVSGARARPLPQTGVDAAWAEELVAEIRAGRDDRMGRTDRTGRTDR